MERCRFTLDRSIDGTATADVAEVGREMLF
jgi:hypothetical protein